MKTLLATNRHSRRAQSLVIAVIVLFVLLFIGGIFVGLVGRNLLNTGRAKDTLAAHELGRAGIKYAEYFLQHSAEGADWRPAPTPIDLTTPAGQNDPDRRWLDPAFQGDQTYSRIDYPNGRALVRVSYQPRYTQDPRNPANLVLDPLGKLIKIESVGRPGVVNQLDPTTFLNVPEPRLRREYVAYKQIGITDYLRYVTNKDNDSKAEAFLGVPPVSVPSAQPAGQVGLAAPIIDPLWMQLGKLQVRTFGGGNTPITNPGAPLRINCNLRLPGNVILSADRRNGEQILIAGDIIHDQVTPAVQLPKYYDPESGPQPNETALPPILESTNAAYSSFGGAVRDSNGNPDAQGYARAISALPPPLLSEEDPASRVTRYRMLSRDSGRWIGPAGNQFNTGRFALGGGIYVDNRGDEESSSLDLAGGQSMRTVWLNPQNYPRFWNSSPHYSPPGAYVEFGYFIVPKRDATNSSLIGNEFVERPGFRITRSDQRGFRDPTGLILPRQLVWTFFIYKAPGQRPVLKAENEYYRTYLRTALNLSERDIDTFLPPFNGVIFAEGNVRVRGLVPSLFKREVTAAGLGDPKLPIRPAGNAAGDQVEGSDPDVLQAGLTTLQLRKSVDPISFTVVSDATVYVEGSIVRETPDTYPDNTPPAIPLVSLLAQDYVTINTTQFLSPVGVPTQPFASTQGNGLPPFHAGIGSGSSLAYDFAFGDNPSAYSYTLSTNPFNVSLFARHAAEASPTYLNLFVNEAFPNSAYQFGVVPGNPDVYQLVDPTTQVSPQFEQKALPLLQGAAPFPPNTYQFFTQSGWRNLIRPAVDTDFVAEAGTNNYFLSRWAVAPMDIRIEAVMYAEGGSFFVIPGYGLNPVADDTRSGALQKATSEGHPTDTMLREPGTSHLFPFYGEPYDCRITIVGAIAENRTAAVADQSAWMQQWGYIPESFGSTGHEPGNVNPANRQLIPDQHVRMGEVGMTLAPEMRTQSERNSQVTRGIRFLYDPLLHAPYPAYDPNSIGTVMNVGAAGQPPRWIHRLNGAHRQDDYGRALAPGARLPLSPGFVFYGEVR